MGEGVHPLICKYAFGHLRERSSDGEPGSGQGAGIYILILMSEQIETRAGGSIKGSD